ncbi:MAG TPA: V-type ATPase subunit [Thermoplasmata archaeon]|nr:V-type ATPase subunit [Thermoplasmata archaeon]
MAGSPYASALGRLKAITPSLLPKEAYVPLVAAKDVGEVTKLLEPTPYGAEIAQSAASYKGAPLLEVAINRTFVHRNRLGFQSAPFAGRAAVGAYLRKWDIQNIGLILAAKAQGRSVAETETFLVSTREIPAGLMAGPMSLDDFRGLLQQPTLDAIAQSLVKFGYGGVLLPRMEAYDRSHDIFPLLVALDRFYYEQLLEATRFFQGDEWVVRQFVQSEIDVRNALLLLKGKDAELPVEPVQERFLDGGTIPRTTVAELYGARTVAELVTSLEGRFPTLPEGNAMYQSDRSLAGYEAALQRDRAVRELKRMRAYPLSVSIIFGFLMFSELERADLRHIVYGKLYGLPDARIQDALIVPRL